MVTIYYGQITWAGCLLGPRQPPGDHPESVPCRAGKGELHVDVSWSLCQTGSTWGILLVHHVPTQS